MDHSTASLAVLERAFASPEPSPASQLGHTETWRRPFCGAACTRHRVLVVEAGFRGWRDLEYHDHQASEQALSWALLTLLVVSPPAPDSPIAVVRTGPLVVDLLEHSALVGDRPVLLSPNEWRLLAFLARRLGRVVSRPALLSALWRGVGTATVLRVLTTRLRAKLGPAGALIVAEHAGALRLRAVLPEGS
jgi:hypothetical protein